jgi:hypothetical protein
MNSQQPDLSHMSIPDLIAMASECIGSPDESDREFAKACRDELAKRKQPKSSQPKE